MIDTDKVRSTSKDIDYSKVVIRVKLEKEVGQVFLHNNDISRGQKCLNNLEKMGTFIL